MILTVAPVSIIHTALFLLILISINKALCPFIVLVLLVLLVVLVQQLVRLLLQPSVLVVLAGSGPPRRSPEVAPGHLAVATVEHSGATAVGGCKGGTPVAGGIAVVVGSVDMVEGAHKRGAYVGAGVGIDHRGVDNTLVVYVGPPLSQFPPPQNFEKSHLA